MHGVRRGRVGLEKRAEVLDMGAAARGIGRDSPRLREKEAKSKQQSDEQERNERGPEE